jgi:hypothetical protein
MYHWYYQIIYQFPRVGVSTDVKILIVVVFVTQKKPSGKLLAIHQTTRCHNLKVPKLPYNTHFTCISNRNYFF